MTVATNTSAASLFSASNTVAGVPIGSAFAGRVVALWVFTDDASSVTIGGVTATVTDPGGGVGIFSAAAVVPTGTTATVVTGPSATYTEILGVWSITGDPDLTPTFTFGGIASFVGDAVDVMAGSSTLGLIFCATNTDTPDFTTGISNNGAAYLTDAGGPVGSLKVRDGSADNAATTTVTVTATGFTFIQTLFFAAVYAGAAPSTVVLPLGAGSYAMAGQAVGLSPASRLAMGAGSYALAGQSVTLRLLSLESERRPLAPRGGSYWKGRS